MIFITISDISIWRLPPHIFLACLPGIVSQVETRCLYANISLWSLTAVCQNRMSEQKDKNKTKQNTKKYNKIMGLLHFLLFSK